MRAVREGGDLAELMRGWASGVTIVACGAPGARNAMTVSSFASVSLAPPTVLVCINESASISSALCGEIPADFSINLLRRGQDGLAMACAGGEEGEARLQAGEWRDHRGTPWLADGQSSLVCVRQGAHRYGTHCVLVGEVVALWDSAAREPLLYADRGFARLC